LKYGDIDFQDNRANLQPFGGFETGIVVSGPATERDFVIAITRSLVDDGKISKSVFRATTPTAPDSVVTILIGVKPVELLQ
jgi:hypothetical protein